MEKIFTTKNLFIIIAATFLIGTVWACIDNNKQPEQATTDTIQKVDKEINTITNEKDKESTVVEIRNGESVSNGKLEISFEGVKEYSKGFSLNRVDEGQSLIILYFDITNISDNKESISALDFNTYIDNYITDNTYLISEPTGYEMTNTTIENGRACKFCIAYKVPNNWKRIESEYCQWLTKNEKIRFIVSKEDVVIVN